MPEVTEAEKALLDAVVGGKGIREARWAVWTERLKSDPTWIRALGLAGQCQAELLKAKDNNDTAWKTLMHVVGENLGSDDLGWFYDRVQDAADEAANRG